MKNRTEAEIWKQHVAILAKPGRGKTVRAKLAAAALMEQGIRVGVVDPTAAWWGMRLKKDGKTPSAFKMVIFGGDHADIQIDVRKTNAKDMGEKIGAIVAAADWSWIIDISHMGNDYRTAFMTAFAETLFTCNRRRLNLFLDECHLYMPQQKLPTRSSAHMTQATTSLVSGGRSRGFCVTMISQRSAKVHKDALTTAESLITLGMLAPQDITAVAGWVKVQGDMKAAKTLLESLPALKVGEGWTYAPGFGVMEREKFPMIDTFDSSSAPGVDDVARAPTELGQVDLEQIRAALAPAGRLSRPAPKTSPPPGPVDLKGNAPTAAAQKAQERATAAALADAREQGAEAVRASIPAMLDAQHAASFAAGILAGAAAVTSLTAELTRNPAAKVPARQPAIEVQRLFRAKLPQGLGAPRPLTSRPAAPDAAAPRLAPLRVEARAASMAASIGQGGDPSLTNPQSHLLRALAWWAAMGHDRPTRAQLAAIAGWKVGGSNLRGRLAELSAAGLISYPDTRSVALMANGHAAAPAPDTATTLMDSIRAMLSNPQRLLFEQMIPGQIHSREEVAGRLRWEVTGSNLRGRLAELSALELIEYPSRAEVRLQEWVK